jgi:UDP-N-acetylmuramate--alanine ligase
MKYYLSGVAGAGMNALAQYLVAAGHLVYGSDRSFDQGENEDYRSFLHDKGVHIVKQDGRSLDSSIDICIFSAAVEEQVPDYQQAQALNLVIKTRSHFLREIYNEKKGIGIAGTSGKTTVTGMLATILRENNWEASVLCGGEILNYSENGMGGNGLFSDSAYLLAEVDESDKVIDQYRSHLALVTNISEDHMPLAEVMPLFQKFALQAERVVYNMDCPHTKRVVEEVNVIQNSFSLLDPTASLMLDNIETKKDHSTFTIQSIPFKIKIPGRYNVENAAAAIAAARSLGIELNAISHALARFTGIKGRFECIGANIYYDFAHNPAKIDALLSTAVSFNVALIIYYQPHGYAPFRSQLPALISIFHQRLRPGDRLIIGKIYDAGGSARRDISSDKLVKDLQKEPFHVFYAENRQQVNQLINNYMTENRACFIVGARDRSLRQFAINLAHDRK